MLVCNTFMCSTQSLKCGLCIAQSCICHCLQRTCQVYYFLISVALMQTTPPCSEGLRWFVFDTPLEIGIDYMEKFQAKLGEFYVRLILSASACEALSAPHGCCANSRVVRFFG